LKDGSPGRGAGPKQDGSGGSAGRHEGYSAVLSRARDEMPIPCSNHVASQAETPETSENSENENGGTAQSYEQATTRCNALPVLITQRSLVKVQPLQPSQPREARAIRASPSCVLAPFDPGATRQAEAPLTEHQASELPRLRLVERWHQVTVAVGRRLDRGVTELPLELRAARRLPVGLYVGYEPWDEHQVEWPLADHLIGDVHVATPGMLGLRRHVAQLSC
jgi:hypothetical protein